MKIHTFNTLFPYGLAKKTARFKIWQPKYAHSRRKRPARLGDFETIIEKIVAIAARWKQRCGRPASCLGKSVRAAALGEARPVELNRFSSCLAGQRTKHPAGRHVTPASWLFAQSTGRCSIVCYGTILNTSHLSRGHFKGPPVLSLLIWGYLLHDQTKSGWPRWNFSAVSL